MTFDLFLVYACHQVGQKTGAIMFMKITGCDRRYHGLDCGIEMDRNVLS